MKSRISAWMDGELERQDAEGMIDAIKIEGEARETWRSYQLIGDSMRDTRQLSAGFAARVSAALAAEPTVLAPRAKPIYEQRRWQVLSVAASLAAVAFVVSVAFAPQEGAVPVAAVPAPAMETAQVAPPDAADDYLLAHQGYSPRNTLQGAASYVRTVSSEVRGIRK